MEQRTKRDYANSDQQAEPNGVPPLIRWSVGKPGLYLIQDAKAFSNKTWVKLDPSTERNNDRSHTNNCFLRVSAYRQDFLVLGYPRMRFPATGHDTSLKAPVFLWHVAQM